MDIVIFGVSGDLAAKKLFPALQSLAQKRKLPSDVRIIGFSRSVKEIPPHSFEYVHIAGNYNSPEDFIKLKEMLRQDKKHLFYLALPPFTYHSVFTSLHQGELVTRDDPSGFRLILAEKPFGQGLQDATELLELSKEYFRVDQCIKIDHYAGKKELRELEDEPVSDIESISFEIHEKNTIEGRANFYDATGALKDIGQNHLLFMLATFFKEHGTREEILSRLSSSTDISSYVFGQYEGYLETSGVGPESKTETYFSIPAFLDKDELRHIKITLSSGKALFDGKACIKIKFSSGNTKEIVLTSGTEAYEHIFEDAIQGKQASFLSEGEIIEAWSFIEGIEKIKKNIPLVTYPKGSDKITP